MMAVMVVGLWLSQAGSASACSLDAPAPPPPTSIQSGTAISLAVPAIVDATMLAFQLGYGDQMLPEELAIVQLVLGSAQILHSAFQMGVGMMWGMFGCGNAGPDPGVLLLGGFIGTFLGSWLIADGIASLQVHRHRERQAVQVLPTASASADGFMLGLGGTF
jgi:hypothetical protein